MRLPARVVVHRKPRLTRAFGSATTAVADVAVTAPASDGATAPAAGAGSAETAPPPAGPAGGSSVGVKPNGTRSSSAS